MAKQFLKIIVITIFFIVYQNDGDAAVVNVHSRFEFVNYVPRMGVGIICLMPLLYLIAFQEKEIKDKVNIENQIKKLKKRYDEIEILYLSQGFCAISLKNFQENVKAEDEKAKKQQSDLQNESVESTDLLQELDSLSLQIKQETAVLNKMGELIAQLQKKYFIKK
jgi:hypothetical protein